MTKHTPIPFGSRFGRLKTLAKTWGDGRGAKYTFRCECGTTITAHATDVRRGKRKTCGCYACRYEDKKTGAVE